MAKKNIATFLGTSNTLSYLGDHAYAYGGVVGVPQSTTTLLSFETGKQYVKGILGVQNGSGSGDDMSYEVSLNGVVIVTIYAGANPDRSWSDQYPLNLIIPPHTTLLVTAYNEGSGSPRNHSAIFEGRVYA